MSASVYVVVACSIFGWLLASRGTGRVRPAMIETVTPMLYADQFDQAERMRLLGGLIKTAYGVQAPRDLLLQLDGQLTNRDANGPDPRL